MSDPERRGERRTYDRLRTFESTTNSAKLSLQHKPVLPWLLPWRFTLIADDNDGLTPEQVRNVVLLCSSHKLTLVEIAFDFSPKGIVDHRLVLRHAKFGKSRLQQNRSADTYFRYGTRLSTKMVRVYRKEKLNCFRVELEIHSALLRKYQITSAFELGRLAGELVPAHIQFVGYRWEGVRRYLAQRFGKRKGVDILRRARELADTSLRGAARLLSEFAVPNAHRFQSPLRLNLRLQGALKLWAEKFPVDDDMILRAK
ncbi:MAG: hypothetical protein WBW53_13570 [Terriglobales bacterium]